MLNMKCEICGISDKKYRCPTCLIVYCSKNCFGQHKSKCIKKSSNVSDPQPKKENIPPPTEKESIYCEVPPEKLDMLRHSKPLADLLRNPHLRELLKLIDDSPDPELIMHKAMQEPLFVEYVDVCMETIKMESS
ncbi:zinc finger HIT domain-containing protein 3 [Coccinella septempunctata]|uniref:zinc finger HIT domain-containing protein 3 n=1 Tax=Coccinella septempunctata TaxID=41139 RepID=UPI001D08893F|nr:zinc finger HIT domain-containing protein 3 [Coccinella septempunctata]